ncbi:MAG TPA: hypothetical protein DIC53_05725 [Synergistaceae bacterium]|jgi:ribosomal protein L7Ae-like RNA K-turn-binding protein|nr:hypothetical protein [Synergistaceae bacterium]
MTERTPQTSILSLFGLARRAGALRIGQDIVQSSLARGELLSIFFAEGADSAFFRSVSTGSHAEKNSITTLSGISEEQLSSAVGAKGVKVVAVPLRSGFAGSIAKLLAEGGV